MRSSWPLALFALALVACEADAPAALDAGPAADATVPRDARPRPDANGAADTGGDEDAAEVVDAGEVCQPSCVNRDCGDDGCGGSCGTCDRASTCSAAGLCEPVDTCRNGLLDPGEQRTDCGGPCPPCPARACTRDDSPLVPDGYDCVWNEEFGGAAGGGQAARALSQSKWTFQNLDVNGEAQNYTNRECTDPEHASDWNYCVQDGLLEIRARNDGIDCTDGPDADDQPDNPDCALDWGQARGATGYTSGRIMTKHKAAFQYGYIEFRARMPQYDRAVPESGFWPAIWLLGNNISEGPPPGDTAWPACGEFDIMEWRSPGNHMGWNSIWANEAGGLDSCAGGAPGCGPCAGGSCTGVYQAGDRWVWAGWGDFPHEDFHVYGLLWTEERMEVFIDGDKMSTFFIGPAQDEFQKEMYLIVNLAIGGALGGAIQITDWSKATLEVDYLRWYQALE